MIPTRAPSRAAFEPSELPAPDRIRVLSAFGRDDTAERWYESDHGPRTPLSHAAPAHCVTCGFFVPLSGGLGRLFGACANASGIPAADIAPTLSNSKAKAVRQSTGPSGLEARD